MVLRLLALDKVFSPGLVKFDLRGRFLNAAREVVLPDVLLIFVLEVQNAENLSWVN